MRKMKSYQEFNEELNLKTAILGGALAASTLAGCDNKDNSTNYEPITYNNTPQKSESPIELPNDFEMSEEILSIGTDMTINSNGSDIGKVEERTLNWGTTFEYFDNTNTKKATGKQKVLSLVTTIEVFDENNKKIGTFEEELLKSLFSFSTYYKVMDASGRMIGESAKLDLFATDIEIVSPSGEMLCKIHRPAFNLLSDSWTINIMGNIDKRLVVFIPCYKTSADNERRSKREE